MNKNYKYYLSVWAIFLAIFNIAVFVSPIEMAGMTKFGGAFWSGYIFITLAFIGQLVCGYIALKADNLRKLFYNIPLISLSWISLVLTLIVGTLCMVIPNLPNWIGIIICFAVLGFSAISVIKVKLAGDLVEDIDNKIKVQTYFIKTLTVEAESLMARAKSEEIKAECKKVYEAIRYSDPMSNNALTLIEDKITDKFEELSNIIADGDINSIKTFANEVILLVGERNAKCKVLK